jgi:hypothetical protein
MPPQAGAMRAFRLFFGLLFLVPALTVVFGIVLIVAGFRQSPHDSTVARTFAGDRSCGPDLTAAPSIGDGNCTVVDATVVRADLSPSSSAGTHAMSTMPHVALRLADGTQLGADLAGADGRAFVHRVYPGSMARAQLFGGRLVRVAENGVTAKTDFAPDVMASSDGMLPWIGGGMIVFGLLAGLLVRWNVRRLGGASV